MALGIGSACVPYSSRAPRPDRISSWGHEPAVRCGRPDLSGSDLHHWRSGRRELPFPCLSALLSDETAHPHEAPRIVIAPAL